jgi:quercetin dioxygenase-like cupin family protein
MRHVKLLPIFAVVYALGCGEPPPPEEYADAVTADPDHYSVEFENDAVRLLRVSYGPGEQSAMHEHPFHCGIPLNDGTWRMTDPAGAEMEMSLPFGEFECYEAGVHAPQNAGESTADIILIEFKEGATAGTDAMPEHPDAVTADPDHYSVEYENDVARVLRIRYEPGETSVMHHHPANCAIFLMDQPGTFEQPDGEVVEMPAWTTGQVECVDAEAHLPTNMGEEPLELVLLELKGRATF